MALVKVGSHPSHGGQVVFNATASFTLDPSDSGKVFILKDAAITVTLPTLSTSLAGFQVKLISGDDSEHIIAGGASKIYGQIGDQNGGDFERIAAASGYTLGTGEIGDWFELISDGTNWYISGLTDNGA
jgi:hypothetical protein